MASPPLPALLPAPPFDPPNNGLDRALARVRAVKIGVRVEIAGCDTRLGAALVDASESQAEILIVCQSGVFEPVQVGVAENGPPDAPAFLVTRLGHLPLAGAGVLESLCLARLGLQLWHVIPIGNCDNQASTV